jgi:ubiquinone biosynthesis protein
MSLSFKPQNLKRYRDLLMLFHKYGHGDLVKKAPVIDDPLPHSPPPPVPLQARELADDIEKLGPTTCWMSPSERTTAKCTTKPPRTT